MPDADRTSTSGKDVVTTGIVPTEVVGRAVQDMTTMTMYDADDPYDIPRDAKMVAGYVAR